MLSNTHAGGFKDVCRLRWRVPGIELLVQGECTRIAIRGSFRG